MIAKVLRNWTGDDATLELASAALSHEDASIRSAALDRINSDWVPRLGKALIALLEGEDRSNRSRAAMLLATTTVNIPGLIPAMTARLADDVGTVAYAIQFLGRRDPQGLLAKADQLLKHDNEYVRKTAAEALIKAHGAEVIDKIGPVILDERIQLVYRLDVIRPFGSLMDMKVVPYLLQALKTPGLQAEAKKQLEAIRFYHEQSSKWGKLVDGSGFTETSALQALIKQAKSDNKDVRLAAIASLGTLGDAESLPFLVDLVGDKDQDIAKAAKAALRRINTADEKPGK
jgi:HEAT repeat protein